MASISVRTCIGCRAARPASELVRLVVVDGARLVVAPRRGRTGRGASVHPRRECVARAVGSGALGRAFRRKVTAPSMEQLLEQLNGRTTT